MENTPHPAALADPDYYGADDAAPLPGAYWHYSPNAVPAGAREQQFKPEVRATFPAAGVKIVNPVAAEAMLELVRNHDLEPIAYRRVDDVRFIVAVRSGTIAPAGSTAAGICLVDAAQDTARELERVELAGYGRTRLDVDAIGVALQRQRDEVLGVTGQVIR